jgi:hypothetical protein
MTQPFRVNLVKAVGEAKGVDPTDLEFVVQEYIDTDALELLAAHENGRGRSLLNSLETT